MKYYTRGSLVHLRVLEGTSPSMYTTTNDIGTETAL